MNDNMAALLSICDAQEARGSKEAAISSLVPLIFQELLSFVSYSVKTPKYGDLSAKVVTPGKPVQVCCGYTYLLTTEISPNRYNC